MRPPTWSIHFLLLVHLACFSHGNRQDAAGNGADDDLPDRRERSVRFPEDAKQLETNAGTNPWRFQVDTNQVPNIRQSKSPVFPGQGSNSGGLLVPVPGTRGETVAQGEGVKKGRKASPDVQDIISGIVHLLGGKVNLHAGTGAPDQPANSAAVRPPVPQSTRINNRAPPRISEVPFEAIPLELGNSAAIPGQPQQQLPFGIPLRPPIMAPKLPPQSGQELPFATGIPLPIQLVPAVPPRGPWPGPVPVTSTTEGTTSTTTTTTTTTEEPTTTSTETSTTPETPVPSKPTSQKPISLSVVSHNSTTEPTISFFPEDHKVRHPPVVLVTTSSVSQPITEAVPSSSIVPVYENTSIDAILQPSIEDMLPSSSLFRPELSASPVATTAVPSTTNLLVASSSAMDDWNVPSAAVPHIEAGSSNVPNNNFGHTPPLPASSGRPGQVFHDEYLSPSHGYGEIDVITSDNVRPNGGYGDTFDVVVTAAQNFGGSGPVAPPPVTAGRPYVRPVPVDQSGGSFVDASAPADDDQYVSIDGRKTYFNLFPTEAANGAAPVVQPTAVPNPPFPVNPNNGFGFAYPEPVNAPPQRPAAARPSYQKPPAAPVAQKQRPSTPALVRRPSTPTPLGRIDACVVGDPNSCLEPNESCQAEDDGSACNCKPGFGRKKPSDLCKALTGLLVSVRLDKFDNEQIGWSSNYANPSSSDYQQLEWEASNAIKSMIEMTPLGSAYVSSSVNKFYSVGNRVLVNATVFLEQTGETQSVVVRPTLMKQLGSVIQQRNNNLGISRLWVDGPNPIPGIFDLNECGSPTLNDCSLDADCIDTPGSFTCQCKRGFSDPNPNDPYQVGRQCNSCTRSHCNNRGECRIENGKKTCYCQGNYKGSTCELDGEVLGVAVGASVAAIIIIILTLVMLCMWSRRWRQNQDKMVHAGPYMDQLKTMPFAAFMQDRLRWAQYAEAMASAHNLYAQPFQPPYYYQSASTLQSNATTVAPLAPPTLPPPPPPVPPRNKPELRQTASLPVSLVANTAQGMISNIQELARKISRKKRPAPAPPDPVNVNPHLALISPPAYPVGTMRSIGQASLASLAPTLPLVGPFPRARSTAGSIHSKRNAPPPPPSNPPPALQVMETSEESATESDAPIARPFHVPRPRSRASVLSSNNIYYEADAPTTGTDFSSQSSINVFQPSRQGPRYYYR